MNENIQTIKIDADGKYIIVIKFFRKIDRTDQKILSNLREELERWWSSDEKFFIFSPSPEDQINNITFEKIENVAS